jgi:hypothetical protein
MSTHGHTTIGNPTSRPALAMDRGRGFVLAVTLLAGLFMTAAGVAALLAPGWFADAAGFPRHPHFVHDAGAFQLGIGITLLLALIWHDGLALALAGLLVVNTTHAVNHAVDLDLGGHRGDPWGLAALSLLTAAAPVVRLGQLGWVVGEVTPVASPVLARFVRHKTVLSTTSRRDGRPVGTLVSLAVDGDHADLRSFEQAGEDSTPPPQPQGGHRALNRPGPTDRPGHRGHGQAPGGGRSPAGRSSAGRQAPTAARRAGAVNPSPGSPQDRHDGPFPADTPRPWPGEVTAHRHPDEPSRHLRGRRACTQQSPWERSL